MIPVGGLFAYTNYRMVIYSENVAYFFLDWINDFEGARINAILLTITLSIAYVILAKIT